MLIPDAIPGDAHADAIAMTVGRRSRGSPLVMRTSRIPESEAFRVACHSARRATSIVPSRSSQGRMPSSLAQCGHRWSHRFVIFASTRRHRAVPGAARFMAHASPNASIAPRCLPRGMSARVV